MSVPASICGRLARLCVPALAVASGLLAAGCNEQGLTALHAEFKIEWPEERGYIPDALTDSTLTFGTVTTGEYLSIPVHIENQGNAALSFCSIQLAVVSFDGDGNIASEMVVEADDEIVSTAPAGPGELDDDSAMDFELKFTPLYGTPIDAGLHLVLKHELNWNCGTDSGDGLYIPISGEGFGEPVPDIYAKPSEVDFGELEVGQSSEDQSIVVGNAGPGLLSTYTISIDDPLNFALIPGSAANASFSNGDVGYLSVQFTPQQAGNLSATISISSNDPDEDPFLIPVFGVANDHPIGKGPVAVCGPDFDSAPFETENYDGSASYDPDGLPLDFQWVLTPPAGSGAYLSSYVVPSPSIALDIAGDYMAELTVTNTNDQSDSCTQTIHAIPNENFRIELFWEDPDDMDLHLLRPQSPATPHSAPGDCFYANMNPDWGVAGYAGDDPSLDLDDIPGTGPENINILNPAVSPYDGWYQVFVHDYPGTVDYYPSNGVTVNIYLNGVLTQTYNFSMSGEDTDYYVAKIEWPSGQIVPCNGLSGCP
jgi:hypothetical protein